jgi:hypothetical protein
VSDDDELTPLVSDVPRPLATWKEYPRREADHVVEKQMGGVSKRIALRVIDHTEPVFVPEIHGKPWKRSECPTARPCPRAFCRAHLYRVDASERAGRKSLRFVPRDKNGLTLSVPGLLPDDRTGTLDAAWLESPQRPSCAWDVIEAAKGQPLDNSAVGRAVGKHRTMAARIVDTALKKLKAAGVEADDLLREVEPERVEHEPSRSHRQTSTRGLRRAP